jgi:flagellar basal-body rod protein FlgB
MRKLAKTAVLLVFFPMIALADGDVTSQMQNKLKYLSTRQSVIADNIANANTPHFRSSDLKPMNNPSGRLQLVTTSPAHISSGGISKSGRFQKMRDKDTYDTMPNGNNVDLEQQMVKMSDTDLQYKETTSMMKQMNGLIRLAVGGN